jgi:hypothetical protein
MMKGGKEEFSRPTRGSRNELPPTLPPNYSQLGGNWRDRDVHRRHKKRTPSRIRAWGSCGLGGRGCRGMGCRPIQSEVINYAPIGLNSRSRAPDLICVGSFGLFSPLLPLQNVLKGLGSSAKSQSTKHLRPNGDGRQKQAKRNQRSNLSDDNANHPCLPRTKGEHSSLIVLESSGLHDEQEHGRRAWDGRKTGRLVGTTR